MDFRCGSRWEQSTYHGTNPESVQVFDSADIVESAVG
jgi:hypothetical protein